MLSQEAQKARALAEAEHHQKHGANASPRNFATEGGDYDNKHLALKHKKAKSNDRMPMRTTDEAYDLSNPQTYEV